MWFGVLGPLEARDEADRPIRVGGPVRRVLLAALLCRSGGIVSAESLIDDLWPQLPPRSAAKTLQSHVVRLRDDLGRHGDSVIVTSGTGYRIDLPVTGLDSSSFETALEDGLAALRGDNGVAAVARLDDALGWWRDEAYLEFGDAPFAVAERMRLAELRALALETRTDAALRLGEAATLIAELEARVRREPYRERSWEQLITAFYRAGRQADALAAYRVACDQLAADLGVDPGPALRELEERVLRQDPELTAAHPLTEETDRAVSISEAAEDICPYRGLSGYGERDAGVFVGRERLTAQVLGRLGATGVVVVGGASGSGKSSLVRAGLVPSLRAGALPSSAAWRMAVTTPADGVTAGTLPDLLVLDQAEEMFSVLDAEERVGLVERLGALVDGGGRLVLVLRGDFFGRLAELPRLARYAQGCSVLVGPMREDELRRVVVEPARVSGLVVEPAVVDAVLEDAVGQPQPLPLVSLALVRAWERRVGNSISPAAYQAGGGVAGALEATAEAVYGDMPPDVRIEARRLLVRMAALEGSSWVRRPVPRTVGGVEMSVAADDLIAGRLITLSPNRLELSHDALLEHWPRLRGWLDERVAAADLLEHLTAASRAWVDAGRPVGDLYRGPRLQAALDWRDGHDEDVSAEESAFLDSSSLAVDEDLRVARRQAATEARGRRRLRWVVAGLAITLVLAVTGALIAVAARKSANRSAAIAQSQALSADARRLAALSLQAPDVATSALLAAAGYRMEDSSDTRGALLSALQRGESALFRVPTPRRLVGLVASADANLLYALENDRTVLVIDAARRTVVTSYPARASDMVAVTGDNLIVAGPAPGVDAAGPGRLTVLDASTGGLVRVLALDAMDGPDLPSVTPDGKWLIAVRAADLKSGKPGPTLVVYDTSDWSKPPRTLTLPAAVIQVAAGTGLVALETADQYLDLVDLASLRVVQHVHRTDLPTSDDAEQGMPFALAPDGRHLAYLSGTGQTSPQLLATANLSGRAQSLPAQPKVPSVLTFSHDGALLAVGSTSGSVNIYRASDGVVAGTLAGHSGTVTAAAWAVDSSGNALFTAGLDSQVVSWDVSQSPRFLHQAGPLSPTADHAERFGDDVVGVQPIQGQGPPAAERLFDVDVRTGIQRSWPLHLGADDYVDQTVSTPDGSRALVSIEQGSTGNRWELWDLRRGVRTSTITPPSSANESLGLSAAISPDGATAVVTLDNSLLGVLALPSGVLKRTIPVHFSGPGADRIEVIPWQFDPDGQLLLGAYDSGPPRPGPPGSAAAGSSGSGQTAADQRLGLLDVTSGRLVAQVGLGDIQYPSAVGWSPDGHLLAVGTAAGTLSTYDARTLALRHEVRGGDAGYVLSASFSADDQTLVTAGTDASMTFWNADTLSREGTQVVIPGGETWWYAWYAPDDSVSGLAPQPTRSAGDDEQWFTFPATAGDWMTMACTFAGSDITPAQWTQYVGDQPYRHVC